MQIGGLYILPIFYVNIGFLLDIFAILMLHFLFLYGIVNLQKNILERRIFMMTKLRGILTFLLLFLTLAACHQQPQEEAVQTEPTAAMTQPLTDE